MLFSGKKEKGKMGRYLASKSFQRLAIGLITIIAAFAIIENGAVPKRYKLSIGDKSPYDITAPRDIVNQLETERAAEAASQRVPAVMTRLGNVPIDAINRTDDFFSSVEAVRKNLEKSLQDQGINRRSADYQEKLELEQALAVNTLNREISRFNLPLTEAQLNYLVSKVSDDELLNFRKSVRDAIGTVMKEEITEENLSAKIDLINTGIQGEEFEQELKNIGMVLVNAIMEPNTVVDEELTKSRREQAYENALDSKVIIKADTRIISYGDIVTDDKLEVLRELNFLETGGFDFTFAAGLFTILLLLTVLLILYMNFFCKKILYSRGSLLILGVIVLVTLLLARVAAAYTPMAIPIFIAPMLIAILLELRLAIVVNLVLTMAISFITKWDLGFMYMAIISGTFSAFIISKANQRSKLSAVGLAVAGINILITVCLGVINKSGLTAVANDCFIVSINGIVSIIFTIGTLPFLESTFNIITPLRLLELVNPNQPLMKRLLMEAPGTYHHSLMVGNLAEVACEAVGGNALLARVGAYYHDVGKLKRPNFFKENQLSGNPHDRMTPNLSTLVITSHTADGDEMALKYKIPMAIRDIIKQHHGTTLVAYFYHKAKKGDKGEDVKEEDFRYSGPRPQSKEAAVVMLADSVEAAVRSMVDKTEGKIEGLVRKIIKDKLDDGQLDLCSLTLKDLDEIANSFMRVFSGYFHEREEYPEIKAKKDKLETERLQLEKPPERKRQLEGVGASDEYYD